MTVPTNTFQTYQAIGNREDLSDIIFNVAPYDTPAISLFQKSKASARYHEWQTDIIPAANAANAVIEGDDAANQAITATSRVGNYCQTSERTVGITTIQDTAVDKAGRKREQAYHLERYSRALKVDMETILTNNQAPVTGNASTASKLRPLCSWITTNTSRGAGGANGTSTTAATDGTQRAMTETLLRTLTGTIYGNSNDFPNTLMCGPTQRVGLTTALTGGATKFYNVDDKKLVATVTVYDSDFGPLKIVPNRFQRNRDIFLLNADYAAVAYLEQFQMQDLAITGLARRKQMWATYTLEMRNEAAHGVIADLS
jgi:hypothetical protein